MSTDDATIQIIIPFRDRGLDPRRAANLEVVMAWWWAHGLNPVVVDDGLEGDAPFNRHKAYNLAVSRNEADVYVFTEADMLIPVQRVLDAARLAVEKPGLVVPFTQYRYLSDDSTRYVRDTFADEDPSKLAHLIQQGFPMRVLPESTMDNGKSIGAVNVVSRETLTIAGGFTEATSGNWYDDNIIEEGFAYLTGQKTRFVVGPAVHLYHLPGWKGEHLSDEDKAATAHNKHVLETMRRDITFGRNHLVRHVMAYRA